METAPPLPGKASCLSHSCKAWAESPSRLSVALACFLNLVPHSLQAVAQWHFLFPFSLSEETNANLLGLLGVSSLPLPWRSFLVCGLSGCHPYVCWEAIKPWIGHKGDRCCVSFPLRQLVQDAFLLISTPTHCYSRFRPLWSREQCSWQM